jgi:hypothetical protein
MPPFTIDPFSHYLGYLATDQETLRELLDSYNGLIVPGTIAAWQQQGTGGFVTTLSALPQAPPYLIDPRSPLFQQGLPGAKASHVALADLLGDPGLVQIRDPSPTDFDDQRLSVIAEHWVEFNTVYTDLPSDKTLDKYARRLKEPIAPHNRQAPEGILPPYFAASGMDDDWWELSKVLFDLTEARAQIPCYRVVCAQDSAALDELLADVDDNQVVVWVSGLDETKAEVSALATYREAIAAATSRDQKTFALYGGFFSVLLRGAGLRGSGHGVGFSEHREWRELPASGAPPARFYWRRAHRFVQPDLAQNLYEQEPSITDCGCPHCDGRGPIELKYHDLMKHSVWCRDQEIQTFGGVAPEAAAQVLRDEYDALEAQIGELRLLPAVRSRARTQIAHLPRWADALS